MAKEKAANCPYLLSKYIDYPNGYCLNKVQAITKGLNKDCGRDCLGSTAKRHMKEK